MLVHRAFDVGGYSRCTLVEDAVLGEMVEEASDAHLLEEAVSDRKLGEDEKRDEKSESTHPLLLATTEDVLPFFPSVETCHQFIASKSAHALAALFPPSRESEATHLPPSRASKRDEHV